MTVFLSHSLLRPQLMQRSKKQVMARHLPKEEVDSRIQDAVRASIILKRAVRICGVALL